ncbi:MAG: DUF542 domain-containing protein, partial [Candidatus Kapaibacterium sp.]
MHREADIEQQRIGDLVLENTNVAAVFDRYGFDYRCHGNIKLTDACKIGFIDSRKVLADVTSTTKGNSLWPIAQGGLQPLIDYIIEKHHAYVKKKTPLISQQLAKCVDKNNEQHPLCIEAYTVFSKIAADLQAHTLKEEEMLFPAIRIISDCIENNNPLGVLPYGQISDLVGTLQYEHEVAGNEMTKIREIMTNLIPPDTASEAIRSVYK